jgi:hypothetical protein
LGRTWAQKGYFYVVAATVAGVYFFLPPIIAGTRAAVTKQAHHVGLWRRQRAAARELRVA